MKRIKNFFKRNLKYSIAFIIGILVHLVVYASTTPLYTSNQIGYDNSNSGLEAENVKDALDALYNKAATCDFGSGEDTIPTMAEMCPDCVYVTSRVNLDRYKFWYTTWNTAGQTPTVVNPNNWSSLGVEDNYDNVYQNTGKTYFFGIKLNENYQIEKAYACDVNNNIPYCLEPDANGDKYQYNVGILNAVFGEENCFVDGSVYKCDGDNTSALIYDYGSVVAGGYSCGAKGNYDGGIWYGGGGC